MSLPIILAIVLTTAILAWGAVYLVMRRQRIAAENRMFRSDPMDAEIGREALRRVFGILADEDPADVPPAVKAAPAPLLTVIPPAAPPSVVAQPSMTDADPAPAVLGAAGAALGSAGRSASVAPASFAKPEPTKPTPITPAPTPAEIAAATPLAASVAAAATPAAPFVLAPAPAPLKFPPSGSPAPTPAAPSKGFRLFAPDGNDKAAAAAASPLLPAGATVSGAPGLPIPVGSTPKPNVPAKPAASGGGRRNTRGNQRPRFIRDSLGALLVTGGIVVVAVAILHPQLSIFTGGVSPATATAPGIGQVSFVPLPTATPSPTDTPSPTPSPSDSPSPSPSDSPSPSPSPTPVVTPVPTPRPTLVPPPPTPVPTASPKPTPKPTPTPPPPIVLSFSGTQSSRTVVFSGTYENGTSWTIDTDNSISFTLSPSTNGIVSWSYTYPNGGDWYPTLTIHQKVGKKTVSSTAQVFHLHLP